MENNLKAIVKKCESLIRLSIDSLSDYEKIAKNANDHTEEIRAAYGKAYENAEACSKLSNKVTEKLNKVFLFSEHSLELKTSVLAVQKLCYETYRSILIRISSLDLEICLKAKCQKQ